MVELSCCCCYSVKNIGMVNFSYGYWNHVQLYNLQYYLYWTLILNSVDLVGNMFPLHVLTGCCLWYVWWVLVCHNLKYWLVLSGNQFTGQVPVSCGTLSELFILDLSRNSLSGTLPYTFGGLKSLLKLDYERWLFLFPY